MSLLNCLGNFTISSIAYGFLKFPQFPTTHAHTHTHIYIFFYLISDLGQTMGSAINVESTTRIDDKYIHFCYDTIKSIYDYDVPFFEFLSFIEFKQESVINEDNCHKFLQIQERGIEHAEKSKEWAAHVIDSAYKLALLVRKDEDQIPEEVEDNVTAVLGSAYGKFKKFQKKFISKPAAVTTLAQDQVCPEKEPTAPLVESNVQQGEQ
jgi:hypothetical protein